MTKGTVVLATVYGDVHDIGKNLVNTILSNNGYTVHDLGKQVPVNRIIDKAVEVDATAIGLSALLVSTSKQMPLCVQELHRAGYRYPVIIGGAAINRSYAQRTLFVDEETPYEPGVFYAKDAFEGLSLMDRLVDPESRGDLVRQTAEAARQALGRPGRTAFSVPEEALDTGGSTVRDVEPISPPFWGAREMDRVELSDVWPHLDLKTLFRLHWGGKGSRTRRGRSCSETNSCRGWRACSAKPSSRGGCSPGSAMATFRRTGTATTWWSSARTRRSARSRGSPSPASLAAIDSAWPTTTCRCRQDGETSRSSRS